MPRLKNIRHELFARERARGVGQMDAYRAVGYTGKTASCARGVARGRGVAARIAELLDDALWSDADDLRPLIDELGRLSVRARAIQSPAGLVAARGLIAEAARLKMLTADRFGTDRFGADGFGADSPRGGRPVRISVADLPPELDSAAWAAKYGAPDSNSDPGPGPGAGPDCGSDEPKT